METPFYSANVASSSSHKHMYDQFTASVASEVMIRP